MKHNTQVERHGEIENIQIRLHGHLREKKEAKEEREKKTRSEHREPRTGQVEVLTLRHLYTQGAREV